MKGGKCLFCESTIETDNEDCLCNECLSELNQDTTLRGATILAIVVIVVLVFLLTLQ